MAQKIIPDLNPLVSVGGTDLFPVDTGIQTFKTTLSNVGSSLQALPAMEGDLTTPGFVRKTPATPTVLGLVTSYEPVAQSSSHQVSSADYTGLTLDGYRIVQFSTGASNRSYTPPAANANAGRRITLTKTDAGSGFILLVGTFNGSSSTTINSLKKQWSTCEIYSDGTNWTYSVPISELNLAVSGAQLTPAGFTNNTLAGAATLAIPNGQAGYYRMNASMSVYKNSDTFTSTIFRLALSPNNTNNDTTGLVGALNYVSMEGVAPVAFVEAPLVIPDVYFTYDGVSVLTFESGATMTLTGTAHTIFIKVLVGGRSAGTAAQYRVRGSLRKVT